MNNDQNSQHSGYPSAPWSQNSRERNDAATGAGRPTHIGSREVSTRSAVAFLWLFARKCREPTCASKVAVDAGNRQKFIGIEACPTDKRPIDIFHAEQVPCIAWLD